MLDNAKILARLAISAGATVSLIALAARYLKSRESFCKPKIPYPEISVLGTDLVVLNSSEITTGLLDKRSTVYSDR